jgi:hypothetical protein
MFRPSDDATVYPFLIPSNLFALSSIKQLAMIHLELKMTEKELYNDCLFLLDQLVGATNKHAIITHPQFGKIYAYEVNGFDSYNLMDDANIPSLLALPYLNGSIDKTIYANTRKFVLSESNPFFFKGKVAEGVGGPHVGMNYIWPMSIIMRAMTSSNDAEIKQCIQWLKTTHAGTGFMHESFHKDDASKFTRKWFAWANTLFGELMLKLAKERPHLI